VTVKFNPPPGWPQPPSEWRPPAGWTPDPSWPEAPAGWQLWLDDELVETVPPGQVEMSAPILDAPMGGGDRDRRLTFLEAENASLRSRLETSAPQEQVDLDDQRVLQDVGIYRYHHPLESAALYLNDLAAIEASIVETVKSGRAIVKSNMFTFDGSLAKGRKMADDLGKLMLRAYNSEADNSIRTLKLGNVVTAKRRIEASRTAIARLGGMMEMKISDEFHELRIREVELTADWLMKKQEERELEREQRAELREQRRVEQELAAERERLNKERTHLVNALGAIHAMGQADADLEEKLAAIDEAIVQNDYRIANIRAGYVYVISNRGAFGENVVKIGLTRRLDPIDRVNELGGASVPFRFDVHTLFFSEDAVTLENELHKHFAQRALNRANARKEFFFATPAEVREVLMEKVGNLLEFKEEADATEYLQSVGLWPAAQTASNSRSAT